MKFFVALFLWIALAVLLAAGVAKAVHGQPTLLCVAGLIFLGLFAKFGCLTHD